MAQEKKLTPMLQQYFEIKKKTADAFVFFRLGDFYEMFGEDAIEASKILGITLTARQKGTDNEIPMCGVPHHSATKYIAMLTQAGRRVALCEQVSDPNLPGIVQREVVKTITPGTSFDESVIDTGKNNYMLSLVRQKDLIGMSFMDMATGEFRLFENESEKTVQSLIYLLQPSEILVSKKEDWATWQFQTLTEHELPYFEEDKKMLLDHFGVAHLEGFGIEKKLQGIKAAALLLHYVKETQKTALDHIKKITPYQIDEIMSLDESTIRNLELFQTSKDFKVQGSLIGVMDQTLTRMGARKIRQWILNPLKKKVQIESRLEAVAELVATSEFRTDLQAELKDHSDIERLTGKIGCRSANARDLHALKVNLLKIPQFKFLLKNLSAHLFQKFHEDLHELNELVQVLDRSIHPEASMLLTEGGIIADGFHEELDELRELLKNGKEWLVKYQEKLRAQTSISTLKVKFNKVFGYHIEVSKAQAGKMSEGFQLKQTLVNAHRYMSAELNEFAEKFLSAEQKIKTLEYELFQECIEKILPFLSEIQQNAEVISQLDVFQSLAQLAITQQYCRPNLSEEKGVSIKNGRHPVIESILQKNHELYIANDVIMNSDRQVMVLTGPNMSGKSSYLRQVALITLMAHIGSFVPAESAEIGLTDRIFTRVGASDDISSGQSTFMVEMTEAANILNNATDRSLIIFDELGRGTSTYDGVSIAWAILEHVSKEIAAVTLFATHYHELIDVADEIPNAFNASVAVSEKEGSIVFLRKVIDEGVDRSYGIEVARLAGLPDSVIRRADHILEELEKDRAQEEQHLMGAQATLFKPASSANSNPSDEHRVHRAITDKLSEMNPNEMTPMQALSFIIEMKDEVEEE
jgi:DNA mismatch repair protein MutS